MAALPDAFHVSGSAYAGDGASREYVARTSSHHVGAQGTQNVCIVSVHSICHGLISEDSKRPRNLLKGRSGVLFALTLSSLLLSQNAASIVCERAYGLRVGRMADKGTGVLGLEHFVTRSGEDFGGRRMLEGAYSGVRGLGYVGGTRVP